MYMLIKTASVNEERSFTRDPPLALNTNTKIVVKVKKQDKNKNDKIEGQPLSLNSQHLFHVKQSRRDLSNEKEKIASNLYSGQVV